MNFKFLFLSLVLAVFLTGCGLVAAFIPPIDIGDPLGVDQQTLTTTFGSAGALSTQAISNAERTVSRSFEDTEFDLRGFSLAELNIPVGFGSFIRLHAPNAEAEFPQQLTLTHASAEANVSDAVNGMATVAVERALDLTFVLDEATCSAGTCSYTYVGSEDLTQALTVNVADGAVLRQFINVIRLAGKPSPNTGQFTMSVTADSEPGLDGFRATFTLHSKGATIRLGG